LNENPEPCMHCGRPVVFDDVNRHGMPRLCECGLEPWTKRSQQPHGDCTMYCNMCEMYVKPTKWDGEDVCPYHQRTMMTEEGPVSMYEEFNQDGEEW